MCATTRRETQTISKSNISYVPDKNGHLEEITVQTGGCNEHGLHVSDFWMFKANWLCELKYLYPESPRSPLQIPRNRDRPEWHNLQVKLLYTSGYIEYSQLGELFRYPRPYPFGSEEQHVVNKSKPQVGNLQLLSLTGYYHNIRGTPVTSPEFQVWKAHAVNLDSSMEPYHLSRRARKGV